MGNEKERLGSEKCEILWRIRACFIHEVTMAMNRNRQNVRLPPEVNRVLYVRNLPYKITGEEMYDIFGKYGAIRQIRVGNTPETRGTAFVVYEDIFDANKACKKLDAEKKEQELMAMKAKYGLSTPGKDSG